MRIKKRCPKKAVILSAILIPLTCLGVGVMSCSKQPETELPGDYPFFRKFTSDEIVKQPFYVLDDKGVLQSDYGGRYDEKGLQYNPVMIATYSYLLYREWLETRDEGKLVKFLIQADWLGDNTVEKGGFVVWEYYMDQPAFGATSPWRSAMANGMAIGVLVRAYALTGKRVYLDTADQAFKAFLVDTQDGGVVTSVGADVIFFEEVADQGAPSSKILNGFIAALPGLYDYWQCSGREDVKQAWDKGVRALRQSLPQYDAKFISLYDLHYKRPAMRYGYNLVHVEQLIWLYEITQEPLFLEYALKFYCYEYYVPFTVTTKGSTDPENRGPQNLYLKGSYWSHNELPTWVELDLGEVKEITKFGFFGYTDETTPKDYNLYFSMDGESWGTCLELRDNKERVHLVKIPHLKAQYIKMEVLEGNGYKGAALYGVTVQTADSEVKPIALTSFRDSLYREQCPLNITDGNVESCWESCPNEETNVIIDLRGKVGIKSITTLSSGLANLSLWVSDNLDRWEQIDQIAGSLPSEYVWRGDAGRHRYLRFCADSPGPKCVIYEITINPANNNLSSNQDCTLP